MIRYVGIILENLTCELLLMQRDNIPTIPNPNKWGIIGGAVEEGEDVITALKREVKEEIDFDLDTFTPFFIEYVPEENTERFIFTGKINKQVSDLTLSEGQDLRFFSANSLPL